MFWLPGHNFYRTLRARLGWGALLRPDGGPSRRVGETHQGEALIGGFHPPYKLPIPKAGISNLVSKAERARPGHATGYPNLLALTAW